MAIHNSKPGFMLLDALLGAALFAIFIAALGSTILVGQMGFLRTGDASRAVFLSEQALEGVRSIRNDDWNALQAGGPYGVTIGSDGTWEFAGSGSSTADGYTTSVTLAADGSDAYAVTATTSWHISNDRSGSVQMETLVTNWRERHVIGNWGNMSLQGSYISGGTPLFRHIIVRGNYAFVTGEVSEGGAGLYVFDVSDPAYPQRVATGLALSADAHHLFAAGDSLFVATEDTGAEVLHFNISDPASLSTSDIIDSIDLPGDGRARSVSYYNDHLYVGATQDSTEAEVYSYTVSDTGQLSLLDSHHLEGSANDMVLKNGYAYLASSQDVAELRVVDVFDPANLQDAPGNGYNLTDVHDGTAVYGFGTGMLLGRMSGDVIEELILFDIADSAVPSPPPGPYYFEVSGKVNDVVVEPGGRYAFMASEFSDKELQSLVPGALVNGGTVQADYYDAADFGRGVYYDLTEDKLFFVTTTSLLIFQPG